MDLWDSLFGNSTPPDYSVGVGPVTTTTTTTVSPYHQHILGQFGQTASTSTIPYPSLGNQTIWNAQTPMQATRGLTGLCKADLAHPAFTVKLEDLANMWTAKFGTDWVSPEDVEKAEDPKFYTLAAHRLVSAGYLEEHSLMDSYTNVYRIIEK